MGGKKSPGSGAIKEVLESEPEWFVAWEEDGASLCAVDLRRREKIQQSLRRAIS